MSSPQQEQQQTPVKLLEPGNTYTGRVFTEDSDGWSVNIVNVPKVVEGRRSKPLVHEHLTTPLRRTMSCKQGLTVDDIKNPYLDNLDEEGQTKTSAKAAAKQASKKSTFAN